MNKGKVVGGIAFTALYLLGVTWFHDISNQAPWLFVLLALGYFVVLRALSYALGRIATLHRGDQAR
ncbi:hypothetical protein [Xanthomonas arboricola]|uniref:hypothetical protein n=1 Tax=Xanthomonas arboricola TaxID=56448 RepID=UPI001609DEBE|nr:hypothetical protein [Xanthomonas arboricola]MBB4598151.1 hypothetical protein [Xanthomonas arboricola]